MKKKNENENLDLISLNSKIFDEISIEELEERLELTKPWICDCSEHGCSCYTGYCMCNPNANI